MLHSRLAEEVGIDPDDIFRLENGLPLEIDENGARIGDRVKSGMIFVDGLEVGNVEDVALRDRRMLSNDGVFIVVATVSEQSGESVGDPEVIFRGVPFMDAADDMVEDLKITVGTSIADLAKKVKNSEGVAESELRDKLHNDVARFVYERTKRRPMVLPVIVEV